VDVGADVGAAVTGAALGVPVKCEVLWQLRDKLMSLQTSRRRKSEVESGEGTDGSCHQFLRPASVPDYSSVPNLYSDDRISNDER
jgi:hypothetical protein